jgi:hypothetical protein
VVDRFTQSSVSSREVVSMHPQPRRSTPSLASHRPEEAAAPRLRSTAPPRTADPARDEEADSMSIPRRPLRAAVAGAAAWNDKRPESQPTLYAEEPVALASVIAQESITSRESGALRMTAFAFMGLLGAAGMLTLFRMAGHWLFG